MDIEKTLSSLTIREKIQMLSGKDFWHTCDFLEKGIDSFEVADGPYGVRKQTGLCDHMGWNKSIPSTAYVSGPGLASSFDRELACETGKHLAAEARTLGVDVLLGPAVNIVRTPLCGRNFEYYSEDPVLAGEMAAAYIKGVQSQGVGTCIKHFAANNQEKDREYIDAVADERTLREIYLRVFEIAEEKAHPWSYMTALNKINGAYCSENEWLLKNILRKDWGFDGLVMSDWMGINNRERALKAGLDLEMPYSYGVSEERLMSAYESGSLSEKDIDNSVRRILQTLEKVSDGRRIKPEYINSDHNEFARGMAERTAVLLKNDDSILPLKKSERILVVGNFAVNPRFKMAGSALVNPTSFDIPLTEIENLSSCTVCFEEGYDEYSELSDEALHRAIEKAGDADKIVIFAGLPDGVEEEGKDRKDMMMPRSHIRLITELSKVNSNIVVVLLNGSVVDMSWDSDVKGILEMFLAGQGLGRAVAKLLFGEAIPGGKLPVTIPESLEETPAYLNYPGYSGRVRYAEGVFIGYRYYTTKHLRVKYPFGYGLSYTSFQIRNGGFVREGNNITLSVEVTNTGKMEGSEVVEIYVEPPYSRVPRPVRTLQDFSRVYLKAGETKNVSFSLGERAFAYFDPDLCDWYAPQGEYVIHVSVSAEEDIYSIPFKIETCRHKYEEITGWSSVGNLRSTVAGREAFEEIRRILLASGNSQAMKLPILQLNGESEEQIDKIPLRMITVLTDNIVNNDIMDKLILTVNQKNLEALR